MQHSGLRIHFINPVELDRWNISEAEFHWILGVVFMTFSTSRTQNSYYFTALFMFLAASIYIIIWRKPIL